MATTLTFTLSDADASRIVSALCAMAGQPVSLDNARAYLIGFLANSVTSTENQGARDKAMKAVTTNPPVVVT